MNALATEVIPPGTGSGDIPCQVLVITRDGKEECGDPATARVRTGCDGCGYQGIIFICEDHRRGMTGEPSRFRCDLCDHSPMPVKGYC